MLNVEDWVLQAAILSFADASASVSMDQRPCRIKPLEDKFTVSSLLGGRWYSSRLEVIMGKEKLLSWPTERCCDGGFSNPSWV